MVDSSTDIDNYRHDMCVAIDIHGLKIPTIKSIDVCPKCGQLLIMPTITMDSKHGPVVCGVPSDQTMEALQRGESIDALCGCGQRLRLARQRVLL